MAKVIQETERKDYIKAIVPVFSEVSNQNVVEKVDDKDYISPNNNTDTIERVRFEVQLNKPYSLQDSFLRLYMKMVPLLALTDDVTSNTLAGLTVPVKLFLQTLIKKVKIYMNRASDVLNNNTEHRAWKYYILKHRSQQRNTEDYELQDFQVFKPTSMTSTTRRVSPANTGAM